MGFWKRVAVNAIIFIALAGFFPSYLHVNNIWTAILAAFILGILNIFVKPFLVLISLPLTVVTLGLFYFVINAFMLELTSYLINGALDFSSFGVMFIVALVISTVNLIITNHSDS